jgi:DNA polymerase-3 subunit beta
MKIICHREAFLSACQLASTAVPSKDVKAVLRNIKAHADEMRCNLFATDLELGLRLDVGGVEVIKPGKALLPAEKIIAILREAREDQLEIESTSDGLTIKGKKLRFELPYEDPEQFPDVPEFGEDMWHEIRAGDLREMIRRTVFSCATESARYTMTGVLWELESEEARLIATDGRRLALAQGPAKSIGGHTTGTNGPVVPSKTLGVLDRNLTDDDEIVKIKVGTNEIFFRTDCSVLYSRLIEGRYPDYRAILPKTAAIKLTVSAGGLLSGVRQASIMSDDETKRLNFHLESGQITFEAQAALGGKSKIEMAVDYDGEEISTSFNPQFLIDMLKAMPPEAELQMELSSPGKPVLFRAGSSYIYLVMPMS